MRVPKERGGGAPSALPTRSEGLTTAAQDEGGWEEGVRRPYRPSQPEGRHGRCGGPLLCEPPAADVLVRGRDDPTGGIPSGGHAAECSRIAHKDEACGNRGRTRHPMPPKAIHSMPLNATKRVRKRLYNISEQRRDEKTRFPPFNELQKLENIKTREKRAQNVHKFML